MTREWLWVCLTRTRTLNDVYIYEHTEEELKQMSNASKARYLGEKCTGYKRQDDMKKRAIGDDYVDISWFFEQMRTHKRCGRCSTAYFMLNSNGNITSNISADRKDNTLCHSKGNCELMCVSCNRAKK